MTDKSLPDILKAFPSINHGPIDKAKYQRALSDLAAFVRGVEKVELRYSRFTFKGVEYERRTVLSQRRAGKFVAVTIVTRV